MSITAAVEAVFVIAGVAHLCAVGLLSVDMRGDRLRPAAALVDPLVCLVAGGLVAGLCGIDLAAVAIGTAVLAFAAMVVAHVAGALWPAGVVVWLTLLVSTVAGVVVAFGRVAGSSLSTVTVSLLVAGLLLSVVRTPSSLMQTYEAWEVGLRRHWHRSREPRLDWTPGSDAPFVTVQVPTYAEPPEIVIGTLDALSRLDYPNFEVLVIDNNTSDERLWRPVEEHCALLGERFRFLHVEGITGAKAGALNWSRSRLDPRTEFVALVDADYQVDANWLTETVGLFEDPELGFVQCPHAYRDYAATAYGRMVTTGYEWAQATEMVSRNEHGAGLTVGTMSLIRLATLDVAGGWGEPFQTEDSEFAIRAHAAGYTSILINRRYGRGLIPETLAELKKQRFRWTYGPGEEFKAHARLYVDGRASRLSGRQRFRHGHYGLVVLTTGLSALSPLVTAALLVSMLVHREVPVVDAVLLVPFFAVLAGRRVLRWELFRREIGTGFVNFVGAAIALLAVRPTVSTAAFAVLVGRRATWRRTNKFHSAPDRLRYLRDAWTEIVSCLVCVAGAVVVPFLLPGGLATVLLVLTLSWSACVYATAPLLATLAERSLAESTLPEQPVSAAGVR